MPGNPTPQTDRSFAFVRLPIPSVVIGSRLREDFGDISSLARSLKKHGLLEPVGVEDRDGTYHLLYGERRVRAASSLGWTGIDAQVFDELSDAQRSAIELAENDDRKDLTEFERSKRLVVKAQKAGTALSTKLVDKPKPRGHAPEYGVPKKDVAEAAGVSASDLVRAEQHVAAVETYRESMPEIIDAPKAVAIDYARAVKAFPELGPDKSPGLPVAVVNEIAEDIRNAPPEKQAEARQAASTYHRIYGLPSPAERVRTSPSYLAGRAIGRLTLFPMQSPEDYGHAVEYYTTRGLFFLRMARDYAKDAEVRHGVTFPLPGFIDQIGAVSDDE